MLGVALSLALVTWPKFDRQDLGPLRELTGKVGGVTTLGDAVHYMGYVDYFRGKAALASVPPPFVYRPVAPALAFPLPVESPMTALNVVNLLSLYASLVVLFRLLRHLGFGFGLSLVGCSLFAVSFPVFYYGVDGGVDPPAILLLLVGLYGLLAGHWTWLLPVLAVGSVTKETVILLVPLLVVHRISSGRGFVVPLALCSFAYATPIALLRWLLEHLGNYMWSPAWEILLSNLRLRAVVSVALAFGLPGVLGVLGFRLQRRSPRRFAPEIVNTLGAGTALAVLLVLYSAVTAYTDGRFMWPASAFTIPMAVWWLRERFPARAETIRG